LPKNIVTFGELFLQTVVYSFRISDHNVL